VESGVKGKLSAVYVIFNITTIYDGSGLVSYIKRSQDFKSSK